MEKIEKFFRFLREYASIRFPQVHNLNDIRWKIWLDELPKHRDINISYVTTDDDSQEETINYNEQIEESKVLIRIRRPTLSRPPQVPQDLEQWIVGPVDDPLSEPTYHKQRRITDRNGTERIEDFEDNHQREREWSRWFERWQRWATENKPKYHLMKIYSQLHDIYSEIQRESERYQLVIADGILHWKWHHNYSNGYIYFPLIILPVQLFFNSEVPEFTVCESEYIPELYTTILLDTPLKNHSIIHSVQEEISSSNTYIHPLERVQTTAFLRHLTISLFADGEFLESPPNFTAKGSLLSDDVPRIWRRPLLMLRERTRGYAHAVEHILEHLETLKEPPYVFRLITGDVKYTKSIYNTEYREDQSDGYLYLLRKILFTKPWNQEQLKIASQLDNHGCVIVQGPPGTGKTHTIANLIGHLLAQGKSILVTAHTSKALHVVREQIPEPLRVLAVSVLDDDLRTRRQLEEAIYAILNMLDDNNDVSRLRSEAEKLQVEREQLLEEIARTRTDLANAIAAEYRSLVVAGQEYSPVQAAIQVAEGIGRDDWIPGPVEQGATLPLTVTELTELYRYNCELSPDEEHEIRQSLLDPQHLLSPEDFEKLVGSLKESPHHNSKWWHREPDISQVEVLQTLAERAKRLGENLQNVSPWQLKLIEVGDVSLFEELFFQRAEKVWQLFQSTARLRVDYQPQLPARGSLDDYERWAEELAQIAQLHGGRLRWFDKLTDAFLNVQRWRFMRSARVVSGLPVTEEHFRALAAQAALLRGRQQLRSAWTQLVTERGGPSPDKLGSEPEHIILKNAVKLRRLLSLDTQQLAPLRKSLETIGFAWQQAYRSFSLDLGSVERVHELGRFLANTLPLALHGAILAAHQREAERRLQRVRQHLEGMTAATAAALREAIEHRDTTSYRMAYNRLCQLRSKYGHLQRREERLERLARVAPAWAKAIRTRSGVHGTDRLPGDPNAAWLWRQLAQELEDRSRVSIQQIQHRLEELTNMLYKKTQQLVERRTWLHRIQKTSLSHKQALVGWLNTVKRLGKGKGRSAPRMRAEAAHLLTKAKDAVPVWIMPLARVAEQIDPKKARFDVVIIDEASQCDILEIIAFYIAENVVVVGDHEQVSPEGAGIILSHIEHLQAQYLQDIPNYHLYDGKRSLYDIARESFGGGLMLVEHFRCVPEIIAFSNYLCYDGRIRPLRESGNVLLKPSVIPYRVQGINRAKVNEEEARTIAAIILAILDCRAYDDKTIGVVSMVGDEQAKHIERLVRKACLSNPDLEKELDKRRLLCGNPAQFQGDERDVVLISMVDSPSPDGPLPLRSDQRFKQRFNVAASRARDQLWVVYSLDPWSDLKPGDLRRELIEFAIRAYQNPHVAIAQGEVHKTESQFELDVLDWLVKQGYRVRSQWAVGYYRIDLVIEDASGRRVAVECDGDRYHPIEKIREDLERQTILERLGWRFIRIRGSEFYRDRHSTMQRVVQELERLHIQPTKSHHEILKNEEPRLLYQIPDEIIRRVQDILLNFYDT